MFIYGRDLLSTLDAFVVGGAGSLDDNSSSLCHGASLPVACRSRHSDKRSRAHERVCESDPWKAKSGACSGRFAMVSLPKYNGVCSRNNKVFGEGHEPRTPVPTTGDSI
jgi:hypothetical protein